MVMLLLRVIFIMCFAATVFVIHPYFLPYSNRAIKSITSYFRYNNCRAQAQINVLQFFAF